MSPFHYFTNLSNTSLPSLVLERRSNMSSPHPHPLAFRSRFRNSRSTPPQDAVLGEWDAPAAPPLSTRSSRWHRRRPLFGSLSNLRPQREVELGGLGVCMIDDGWALLVHPKANESERDPQPQPQPQPQTRGHNLPITPPQSPETLPPPLPPPSPPLISKTAPTPLLMPHDKENQENASPNLTPRQPRSRNPTPLGLSSRVTIPGHNLHDLDKLEMIPPRRQSLHASMGPSVLGKASAPPPGAPPSAAFLRPPPGRPVSIITPAPAQAPVSALRRQSLPPGLENAHRPSIKFADAAIAHDLASREQSVASLNESLRIRRSYASLQSRHAQLYDAAQDARNEIFRLRGKLAHSHDVMEHLISWGLAMQTENEILREQIPDAVNTIGPVSVKTAEELRALFDINLEDD